MSTDAVRFIIAIGAAGDAMHEMWTSEKVASRLSQTVCRSAVLSRDATAGVPCLVVHGADHDRKSEAERHESLSRQ